MASPSSADEILGLAPTDAALDMLVLSDSRSIASKHRRAEHSHGRIPGSCGMSTKKALRILREADPGGSYDYNHIYSRRLDRCVVPRRRANRRLHGSRCARFPAAGNHPAQSRVRIGLLDSGVDVTHPVFRDSVVHAWGCGDHAVPAAHGTAVASLLIGHSEVFRGVHPDAELYAADVYCGRPTGGAVDTLVAAFGWLVQEKVPVINVSLVGPKNVMLERVIGRSDRRRLHHRRSGRQ